MQAGAQRADSRLRAAGLPDKSCVEGVRRPAFWARNPRIEQPDPRAGPRAARPAGRLSYTITMRSIIPAPEALASTDANAQHPAAHAEALAGDGSRAVRGPVRGPAGHGV